MKTLFQIIILTIIPNVMNSQKTTFFVGTTDRNLEKAVAIYHMDEKTGDMELFKKANGGIRPGYLALSNDKNFLFAVSSENYEGMENEQSINAFKINDKVSELSHINQQPSRGKNPTHISVNPVYDIVYAANYNSGSVVSYAFDENGRLTPPLSSFQHEGSGPNTDRQKGPHAHYIHASMNGKYVYSADLGIDKIMIYKQEKNGEITPNENQEFLKLEPGSGPRHMAFHKNRKWVFILTELSNEVVACKINNENGSLEIIDKKSTLDEEPSVFTKAAAIRIHPNGKYLYASNRGVNSIAVFEIMEDETIRLKENFYKDIGVVRDFNISPSGKYLIAGNQDEDKIVLLKINEDGSLEPKGKTLPVSKPSNIVFY
jgi:6-phosphogluconolactonase